MRKAKTHSPEEFGLDIFSGDDDLFRWFLLVYLLGKPIQSTVAVRTWQLFIDRKLDLPWTILDMSDHQLVSVLHQGGYTRYQHVMTRALKTCMQQLVNRYDGSLTLMIEVSSNEDELSKRLQELYGVWPKNRRNIYARNSRVFCAPSRVNSYESLISLNTSSPTSPLAIYQPMGYTDI